MDLTTAQALLYNGLGRLAGYLGQPASWYHPVGSSNPIVDSNQMGSPSVAIDVSPEFSFTKPSTFGHPIYFAGFDASLAAVGDYLAFENGDTYFIASLSPLKAPCVVLCNGSATFSRPGAAVPFDSSEYANYTFASTSSTVLAANWPVSILQGTKGERGVLSLPIETRKPWIAVLAPASIGITIKTDDQMVDDRGRHFTISSVELSDLGWRLTAELTDA